MCGIAAYSGTENVNLDKLKYLILANQSRGEDAAGYYSGEGWTNKLAGPASTNLLLTDFSEAKLYICHTRAATVGNKTDQANAHPFIYKNNLHIAGVHNGRIENYVALEKKYDLSICNVDSMILFKYFAKYGNYDILKNYLGAAAIVWTILEQRPAPISEKEPTVFSNKMFVYRDDQRPLFYGMINNGMYLSSLESSLLAIGCSNIKPFSPNYVYTIVDGKFVGPPVRIDRTVLYEDILVKYDYDFKTYGYNIDKFPKTGRASDALDSVTTLGKLKVFKKYCYRKAKEYLATKSNYSSGNHLDRPSERTTADSDSAIETMMGTSNYSYYTNTPAELLPIDLKLYPNLPAAGAETSSKVAVLPSGSFEDFVKTVETDEAEEDDILDMSVYSSLVEDCVECVETIRNSLSEVKDTLFANRGAETFATINTQLNKLDTNLEGLLTYGD